MIAVRQILGAATIAAGLFAGQAAPALTVDISGTAQAAAFAPVQTLPPPAPGLGDIAGNGVFGVELSGRGAAPTSGSRARLRAQVGGASSSSTSGLALAPASPYAFTLTYRDNGSVSFAANRTGQTLSLNIGGASSGGPFLRGNAFRVTTGGAASVAVASVGGTPFSSALATPGALVFLLPASGQGFVATGSFNIAAGDAANRITMTAGSVPPVGPSPIPLPGTLPLALAAMALVGLVAHRRAMT